MNILNVHQNCFINHTRHQRILLAYASERKSHFKQFSGLQLWILLCWRYSLIVCFCLQSSRFLSLSGLLVFSAQPLPRSLSVWLSVIPYDYLYDGPLCLCLLNFWSTWSVFVVPKFAITVENNHIVPNRYNDMGTWYKVVQWSNILGVSDSNYGDLQKLRIWYLLCWKWKEGKQIMIQTVFMVFF